MLLSQSKETSAHSAVVIVICDEYAAALSCLCQHWQMPALASKQKVLHRIMLLQKKADLVPLLQCVLSLLQCVRVSATVCTCVCYSVYVCLFIEFSLAIRACLVIQEAEKTDSKKLEPECSMAYYGKHKSFTRLFPKFPRLFDSFTQ